MSNPQRLLVAFPVNDRPRERLFRSGAASLSDAELLALLLGSGQPGRNVVDRARDLLHEVGGFAALMSMDATQLQRLRGIGPATTGRLIAASEMWRRANRQTTGPRLDSAGSIARVVLPELSHRPSERFLVVVTDRALRLRDVVLLREGTDHVVHVEAREVLVGVLARNGGAFAVAHNHPGGTLEPSRADAAITASIRLAAEAVGVRFLDHILVGGGDWRSIA